LAPKKIQNHAPILLLTHFFFNWGDEPYINCAYSYPAVGTTQEMRKDMCTAFSDDRMRFAGEYAHPIATMTMQSAIESGIFASKTVLNELSEDEKTVKKPHSPFSRL